MGRPRVRDKILLAASELLSERGVTGLTTRGVAAQAGVTEASVFNNFGDKGGLIQALLREQVSEYQLFLAALAAEPDGDLPRWLARVFTAARDYFRVVLPLAAPQLSRGPKSAPARPRESFIGHAALRDRLLELQSAGDVAADANVPTVALLLMGSAMHSALTAQTLGEDALGAGQDELASEVAHTLGRLL